MEGMDLSRTLYPSDRPESLTSGRLDCQGQAQTDRPGMDSPETQLEFGVSCVHPGAMAREGARPQALTAPARVQSGMENFRKVKTSEEKGASPFPELPPGVAEMKVKEGSKIRSLMGFAVARMGTEGTRQIVFSGCGRATTKAVTCAEILKRRLPGLHQVTRVRYRPVREVWEKPDPRREWRADRLTVLKSVPCIAILLSKDPLDPEEAGYQPPETALESLPAGVPLTLNTPPKTEKRHLALPNQPAVAKAGDKVAKAGDTALAQIHVDYMLNCYPPVPSHPNGHVPCVYSA